jgi:uncharacterized damage-inducible protein DinB
MPTPEVWMRGPVEGIAPLLQPVAHSFLQVIEDLEMLTEKIDGTAMWKRPGNAAAIAFHIRHIAGATDRLLTYARGESLTPDQLAFLKSEGTPDDTPLAVLTAAAAGTLRAALEQLRTTSTDDLLTPRKVGRAGLPSTTLGLLFHAAEHATRHTGQAITTALILRGGDGQMS